MGNDKLKSLLELLVDYLENIMFYVESVPDLQDMPLKHYLLIKSLVTEKDGEWDNLVDKIILLLEDND